MFAFIFFFFFFFFFFVVFFFHSFVVRGDTWNNFYTLKLVEVSFMPQYVVSPRGYSMCTWKECIFWGFFGCNVLKMLIRSNFSIVSFKISVALLIFYLEDLSIDVSGVLKSPTVIVFLSISPFMSVSICCQYVGAPILGAYMLMIIISSSWMDPLTMKSEVVSRSSRRGAVVNESN